MQRIKRFGNVLTARLHPEWPANGWWGCLLHLAATHDCELRLGESLIEQLQQGKSPSLAQLQQQFGAPASHRIPVMDVQQHDLASYNQLLNLAAPEVTHGHR